MANQENSIPSIPNSSTDLFTVASRRHHTWEKRHADLLKIGLQVERLVYRLSLLQQQSDNALIVSRSDSRAEVEAEVEA